MQYEGYGGGNLRSGPYLAKTRAECARNVTADGPSNDTFKDLVSGCILQKFTEYDKALFASRQYILTLWPAFVGAIVALAPDPGYVVYDNMWWALLFAVTCGGLPGLDKGGPPHHVEAQDEVEGRSMCEAWKSSPDRPKRLSKRETMGPHPSRGKGHVRLEWLCFLVGFALWWSFLVYFSRTLLPATDFAFSADLKGAVWYYISCSPAVLAAIFELMQTRIELCEPGATAKPDPSTAVEQSDSIKPQAKTVSSEVTFDSMFRKVQVKSVFHLWLRILLHQWRRTRYRILARDESMHWFFIMGRAAVGIGRVTVFAFGSVTMGNIILLPAPDDTTLFVLLLFTTTVPRQLWPAFWTNGNRGADLVVFVRNIRLPSAVPSQETKS